MTRVPAHVPEPRSDRTALALALGILLVGAGVLAFVVSGAWRSLEPASLPAPPPVVVVEPTPAAGVAVSFSPAGAIVARPLSAAEGGALSRLPARTYVAVAWEAGFYPLYDTASRTFGVNWLLLASIHKQETAFSTAPSTYRGLNFAGCCGGPMQFNVTNGARTTWARVRDAYLYAPRPAAYNHPTARHPSIYDDFDSLMAAGRLLSTDGAGRRLDGSAWRAAYDYYGHDRFGVTYADQVLARAISWSQHGFCVNCELDSAMVAAVHAAYGAPALNALAPPAPGPARHVRVARRRVLAAMVARHG